MKPQHTVDIDKTCAVANQPFRCREKVVNTNTEPDFLNDLIGIFAVEVVMDRFHCLFSKVLGRDLNKIRNLCLQRY